MLASLVPSLRRQFPALARQVNGNPAAYFDGPGGTQVPQSVIDAMVHYLSRSNANRHGAFVTSQESDEIFEEAHRAAADLIGTKDPGTVVFGANMTTLTFALSRALARTWRPGDEIIVTRLDHDANVTPWVLAARDAGATVRYVGIRPQDCTLDLEDLHAKISSRTRLVAVGCASNATGTVNPIEPICRAAHEVGAQVFLDAVHYAPHALTDVEGWGCDFLACSVYKFFGPHVGVLWGRRELLEQLPAYKVRPAPNEIPEKWMTGTQNHEGLAGTTAAINYLAEIGRQLANDSSMPRRQALEHAWQAIRDYEVELVWELIEGLQQVPQVQIFGITERRRAAERLPTVALVHKNERPQAMAARLAQQGLFVWNGHFYALELSETLKLQPDGMVRIGLVHYNSREEVQRLLQAV